VIVVDASAALELILNRPPAAGLRRKLIASGETLHAPYLLDVEVLQVLRRYFLNGALTEDRARIALSAHLALPIERYPHDPLLRRAWELRANLTAYDAMYVALAEALGARLVTADAKLAKAASRNVRVELAD
jgi:predicted nucleic acid-binding protein